MARDAPEAGSAATLPGAGLLRAVPPAGFRRLSQGPRVLVIAEELAGESGCRELLAPGRLRALFAGAGGARGRGPTARLPLPGSGGEIVLRRVLHGGLLAPLWGGSVLGLGRPLRELAVTAQLRAAGAPVPRPALVWAERRLGPLWSAALGTWLERDALDGVAFLASAPDRRRLLAAAAAAGTAVRRFHDAGGRHADLHVKNLLLRETPSGFDAVVIDLDRARVVAGPTPVARMRELMRLWRSLRKRRLLERVGARGVARFFEAYLAGDRALRRALRGPLRRERARTALHALAYRNR